MKSIYQTTDGAHYEEMKTITIMKNVSVTMNTLLMESPFKVYLERLIWMIHLKNAKALVSDWKHMT